MIKDETIRKGGIFLYRFISIALMLIMFVMVVYSVNRLIPIDFNKKDNTFDVLGNMVIDGVLICVYTMCIRDYFRTTKKTE